MEYSAPKDRCENARRLPGLAMLTLGLPESDGEPVETERERMQINLFLDVLDQHWQDRQGFYAAGAICSICYLL